MEGGRRRLRPALIVIVLPALAAGCHSPLDGPEEDLLRRTVVDAVERELRRLPPVEDRLMPVDEPGEVEAALAERREELEGIGPDRGEDLAIFFGPERIGVDLTGSMQQVMPLSLEAAIGSAVQNNLSVQIARLQPAITEAEVVAAEALFDAIWFSNASFSDIDEPNRVPVLNGVPLGTALSVSDQRRFETGVRKRLTGGGEVSLSTSLTRSDNQTPGIDLSPDPAYDARVNLGLSQPLLRNFGAVVNTAEIRLTRNAERRTIQELRTQLLEVVLETETAYWDLLLAWHDLAIREWLVEVGVGVRDVLDRRRDFDTTPAEFSDAVARVEERRADVIRARRRVRSASDQLKVLRNDPQVTVGSEIVFAPIDRTVAAPIAWSLRDAIVTAIDRRPEVAQAILEIDDTSIREAFADNQRLPLLSLNAEVDFIGLDDDADHAYDEIGSGRFVDYFVALAMEVPIGNRAAEAQFRQARLQRSAAVIGYRQAVQNVVLDVKDALRDVITNYELIQATRSSRLAQAENLRALAAEEETLASLTPEFLNLKFNRQEALANARLQEVLALVDFDQAMARLYRAMGIGLEMNRIQVEVVDLDS